MDEAVWEQAREREMEQVREAALHLCRIASELQARNLTIPCYGLWAFLSLAPRRQAVLCAGSNLIGISNATPPRDHDEIRQNLNWRAAIMRNLGLAKFTAAALAAQDRTNAPQQDRAQPGLA